GRRRERTPEDRADREVAGDGQAGWLTLRQGRWLLVVNLAEYAQRVPLPSGDWQVVLASIDGAEPAEELAPWATLVCRCDGSQSQPSVSGCGRQEHREPRRSLPDFEEREQRQNNGNIRHAADAFAPDRIVQCGQQHADDSGVRAA